MKLMKKFNFGRQLVILPVIWLSAALSLANTACYADDITFTVSPCSMNAVFNV